MKLWLGTTEPISGKEEKGGNERNPSFPLYLGLQSPLM